MLERFLDLCRNEILRRRRDKRRRQQMTVGRFECLESRSLLTAAPLVNVGAELDRLWLAAPMSEAATSIVAEGQRETAARMMPLLPGQGDSSQGLPNAPPWGVFPELPPLEMPSVDDGLGGYYEMDPSDVSPASGGTTLDDRFGRAVTEMLAELTYLPTGAEPVGEDSPAAVLALLARDQVERARLVEDSAASVSRAEEGGMMVLPRLPYQMETAADDAAGEVDIDSLLDTAPRIEATPARFQAFEVSLTTSVPHNDQVAAVSEPALLAVETEYMAEAKDLSATTERPTGKGDLVTTECLVTSAVAVDESRENRGGGAPLARRVTPTLAAGAILGAAWALLTAQLKTNSGVEERGDSREPPRRTLLPNAYRQRRARE